jgi:hypothetical protein
MTQRIACRAYIRLFFQVIAMIGSLELGGKFQFSKDAHELFALKPQTHDSQYLKRIKEPWGLPVTVHYHHRCKQIHKLQFLNVTHLSKSVLINVLEHLVDDDISALPTRRIDFTVDIEDVPVLWCRESFLFAYKQDSQEIAKCLGTQSKVETVRYGSYKNCLLVDVMDCQIEDLPDDYIHQQLRKKPWILELKDELQRRDDNKERM